MTTHVPLSVLDLVLVREGGTPAASIAETTALAKVADEVGFSRYWMAEHHNMEGVGSSATAVLIGHVAHQTQRIRVGSGGVMLPNHAPLVVAEQFGTLAAIHGDRIDLGLGRAPGTDPRTAHALRRQERAAMDFAAEVGEVQRYLARVGPEGPGPVRAVPGEGSEVPIWILGSSHGGAQVAAALGLPYAFASHFAPSMLLSALDVYRGGFVPGQVERPRVMVAVNVMVASSSEEARLLFTSTLDRFHSIVTGQRGLLRAPDADLIAGWSPREAQAVQSMASVSAVGSPDEVVAQLERLVELTGADELIVTCAPFDQEARAASVRLLAEAWLGS